RWPALPASYWAALMVLLKVDLRVVSLLVRLEPSEFLSVTTRKTTPTSAELLRGLKAIRHKLSVALRLAVEVADEELEVGRPSGAGMDGDEWSFSALVGALDDVRLYVDVRDTMARKGLRFDAVAAGTWATKASAFRVVDHLLTEDPAVALDITKAMFDMLESQSNPRLLCKFATVYAAANGRPPKGQRSLEVVKVVERMLSIAIAQGAIEAVDLILDVWAGVFDEAAWLDRAALAAVEAGNVAIVSSLLAHGVNPDARNASSKCLLHLAAQDGKYEVAEVLLERGAAVRARDRFHNTPLHDAAARGHVDIVGLLLRNGADVKAVGERGRRPIHLAAEARSPALMVRLLDAGAAVDARDSALNTALHYAAERGDTVLAATVLARGADVEAANASGQRPLHKASSSAMVQLLLAHGASPAARDTVGNTAAHSAAQRDGTATLAALLAGGADVDAVGAQGRRPLHVAAHAGADRSLWVLLQARAAVDARDGDGRTALLVATRLGSRQAMRLLLAGGADPNGGDGGGGVEDGQRPVHAACVHWRREVLQQLLEAGASVSARDGRGRTPLHVAATHGHVALVKLLLAAREAAATAQSVDGEGRRPADCVPPAHRAAIVGLLETAAAGAV
ncbi:hypothetical protein HK405_013943, partial [Cladochytrium tenue]